MATEYAQELMRFAIQAVAGVALFDLGWAFFTKMSR